MSDGALIPSIQCEAMLLDWSVTARGGAKIVLQIPSAEEMEPFKALTLAKRGGAGQRMAAVFVLIGDDEQPLPLEGAKHADKPLGGPLARLAGIWCGDETFQRWVTEQEAFAEAILESPEGLDATGLAAHVIRIICNVASRAELDHDARAAALFHKHFRDAYARYLHVQEG